MSFVREIPGFLVGVAAGIGLGMVIGPVANIFGFRMFSFLSREDESEEEDEDSEGKNKKDQRHRAGISVLNC